jgi:hypothetical protein
MIMKVYVHSQDPKVGENYKKLSKHNILMYLYPVQTPPENSTPAISPGIFSKTETFYRVDWGNFY